MNTENTRCGFTLIELLVVVLIIGVLAAIALPMYQKAVMKSRFAALMPIAKSMADSNEAYYLEHGNYADNADELPVQGQTDYPDGTELEFGTTSEYAYVLASRAQVNNKPFPNHYIVYQKHSEKFPDNIHCEALEGNEQAQEVCLSLGGQKIDGSLKDGYLTYVLSGMRTLNDKFPAFIMKLKSQICGTQYVGNYCVVDEQNNTITTKDCGQIIVPTNAGNQNAVGCANTVYDEEGNEVGETYTVCGALGTGGYGKYGTFQNDTCMPIKEGPVSGSEYEITYGTNGKIIETKNCNIYSTTDGCQAVEMTNNSTEGFVRTYRKCSSGSIDLNTLACPDGLDWGYEKDYGTVNKGSEPNSVRVCSAADPVTGACTQYAVNNNYESYGSALFVASYERTLGPNFGVDGNQDYTDTVCTRWVGTTCAGTWEITNKQEGSNSIKCYGVVTAQGVCSKYNGKRGEWYITTNGQSSWCQSKVNLDTYTCVD